MEFPSILYWTPGLLPTFKRSRKYDLVPYLPIIHCGETSWTAPYNVTYVLDSSSARTTEMVLDDFHEVLNEGYYDYLDHLETWSNKYELRHSCQPAYNLPLDMVQSCFVKVLPGGANHANSIQGRLCSPCRSSRA